MIELNSETVSILYPDGTSAAFDPAELRLRIERSCSAAGVEDAAIAEDIVLAVEFALRMRLDQSGERMVRCSDIDDCVERVLEDTGFPAVARQFSDTLAESRDFGRIALSGVEAFLTAKLQLNAVSAASLTPKVTGAMRAIGCEKCSPALIVELARFFREEAAASRFLQKTASPPPEPVAESFSYPEPLKSLLKQGILSGKNTFKRFPSVRIEINFRKCFETVDLEPPLPELAMAPKLYPLAEAVDCYRKLLSGNLSGEILPLILIFAEFRPFVCKYLAFDPENPEKDMRNFSKFFCSMLTDKPFKVFER